MPGPFLNTGAEPHYVDERAEHELQAKLDRYFGAPRQARGIAMLGALHDPELKHIACIERPPLPKTQPACTADACAQGRKACPTPDACRRPVDERFIPARGDGIVFGWPVAVVVAAALFGLLVKWSVQ